MTLKEFLGAVLNRLVHLVRVLRYSLVVFVVPASIITYKLLKEAAVWFYKEFGWRLLEPVRVSERNREFFRIPGWQQALAFLVAFVAGTFIYTSLVETAYANLSSAYRKANVFVTTLHANPMLPQRPLSRIDAVQANPRVAAMFRMIQSMGGHPKDVKLEEVFGDESANADKAYWRVYQFVNEAAEDAQADTPMFSERANTLDFVYALVGSLGGQSIDYGNKVKRDQSGDQLAVLLAGRPGVHAQRVRNRDKLLERENLDKELRGAVSDADWVDRWFGSGSIIRGEQVVKLLLEQFHFTTTDLITSEDPASVHAFTTVDVDPTTNFQLHADTLVAFASQLVSMLHADPGVKEARARLSTFRGYEQYALIILFVWMLLLLVFRSASQLSQRNEVWSVTHELLEKLQQRFKLNEASPDGVEQRFEEEVHSANVMSKLYAKAATEVGSELLAIIAEKQDLSLQTTGAFTPEELDIRRKRLLRRSLAFHGVTLCVAEAEEAMAVGRPLNAHKLESLCTRLRRKMSNSRWLIRWTARAMPAVGFVGTVRGISLALSDADAIVRESTALGQAAAVSEVAGVLGLSFVTTLLALLFGIVTSFFNDKQASHEENLINELDSRLRPLLDPALLALDTDLENTGGDATG